MRKNKIYLLYFDNPDNDPEVEKLNDRYYTKDDDFGALFDLFDLYRNILRSCPYIKCKESRAGGNPVGQCGVDFAFSYGNVCCTMMYDMDHFTGMEDVVFNLDDQAGEEELVDCLKRVFSDYLGYPLKCEVRPWEGEVLNWWNNVVFKRDD